MLHVTDPPVDSPHAAAAAPERGFTLVEVIVVVAIVALAALITIPNLQRVRVKTSASQALRRVSGAFDLARFEATKRRSPVGVVYDLGTETITVFEDWDPNNQAVGSNGNQTLDGGEETIVSILFPSELQVVAAPPGDTTPAIASTMPAAAVVYGSDGGLRVGGGAVVLQDRLGNTLRVRVNAATGEVREEFWLPSDRWSAKREEWKWEY